MGIRRSIKYGDRRRYPPLRIVLLPPVPFGMFAMLLFAVTVAVFHFLQAVEIAHLRLTYLFEVSRIENRLMPLLPQSAVVGFTLPEIFGIKPNLFHPIEFFHQFIESLK